ncbi:MAG: 2,3-bisphosphoglycerate-independent phosphoglycerate mutase [Parcubacteria group bacterium Licking1014_17]|nr:MAG: 2,3-bisphosphoglycerate-independent phosphoglycerate mutase [Parcubacteria group bacterium Licking1014_17]
MKNYSFKKVLIIILDGFGLANAGPGNAVTLSGTPFINSLVANYPSFSTVAAGLAVGLPWGKFGNSEVGHSAIGSGRIIVQDWSRINRDITSGDFFQNQAFLKTIEHCRQNKSNIHIIGCFSPGGIHAHEDHLFALLKLMIMSRFSRVYLHLITDGEDCGPTESLASLDRLAPFLIESGAKIASIGGRTFAMDRVLNWDLIEKAWKVMVDGEGEKTENVKEYLKAHHVKGEIDDSIPPAAVTQPDSGGQPVATIKDNDAVLFFNYRNDRMKQIVSAFALPSESLAKEGFVPKGNRPQNLFLCTMSFYSDKIPVQEVAYRPVNIVNSLGDFISKNNLKQLRISEKEKEAHVTSFFGGGKQDPYPGEERIIISSRKLKGKGYIEHPEMSADEVTQKILERLGDDTSLYVINYANPDMTGHTGNVEAGTQGVTVVDQCVQKVVTEAVKNPETAVIITCDHGNVEEMIDPLTGGPDTQHSSNNVVTIFVGKGLEVGATGKSLISLASENYTASVIDVAPSVLALLGFEKPQEMTGSRLI